MDKGKKDKLFSEVFNKIVESEGWDNYAETYLFLEDLIQQFIYFISESYDHQGPKEEIPELKEFFDIIAKRRAEDWHY